MNYRVKMMRKEAKRSELEVYTVSKGDQGQKLRAKPQTVVSFVFTK